MVKQRYRQATESPIAVRTRFHGNYVCVQDLQAQLHRDAALTTDEGAKEFALELVERLEGLKE